MNTTSVLKTQSRLGSRTLLARVMLYENPDLVARLQSKLGLSPCEATELFDDTKRFLYLCGTTPGKWSPTKRIDEGWHHFILFTQDYAVFCNRYFGRFIHHAPWRMANPAPAGATCAETAAAAAEILGCSLSDNWSISDSNSVSCSKSGCNCSPDTGGGGAECCPDYD